MVRAQLLVFVSLLMVVACDGPRSLPATDAGGPPTDAEIVTRRGGSDVCVARGDGDVLCVDLSSGRTTAVSGTAGATAIDSFGARQCAIVRDGSVACWERGDAVARVLDAGVRVVRVDVADSGVCGATEDRRVGCFNREGALRWVGLTDALDVAALDGGVCALHEDGRVRCVTDGSLDVRTLRVAGVVAVDAYAGRLVMTSTDGTVHTVWSLAEVLAGEADVARVPGVHATELTATSSGACAITLDQHVTCWGEAEAPVSTTIAGASELTTSDPLVCARVEGAHVCVDPASPHTLVRPLDSE